MNRKRNAEKIFLAGVKSVLPGKLISDKIKLRDNYLVIGPQNFYLDSINKIYVIGAGKASALMALETEKILGNRITGGQIIVKYGHSCELENINVTEAGHPLPDSNGFCATEKILEIAAKVSRNDLVICLLSGGGSALLPDFPKGSSPEEIISVNDLLVNCGASIDEINTVRKHLSMVKGGQLARAFHPATLISLILSDVVGDQLSVIASGPTSPDPTTYRQALDILRKYELLQSVPENILKYLQAGESGDIPETPKPGDPVFDRTSNIIVGSNHLALEAAKREAENLKFNTFIITDRLQGEVTSSAGYIAETSLKYLHDEVVVKPVCLLFGGETTVKISGNGLGGRNQHLALTCSMILSGYEGITVLAAGTDGTDGPTDVAGAVVDKETIPDAISENIDPEKFLKDYDTYHFFKLTGGHIITGPTLTNVMDIIVVIVENDYKKKV